MNREIRLKCCEGNEKHNGQCLRARCPLYILAKQKVERGWPRQPTGFGNAYGEPGHSNYLNQVRSDIALEERETR